MTYPTYICRCGTGVSMDLENEVGENRRWVCDGCGGHVCYEGELDPDWPEIAMTREEGT